MRGNACGSSLLILALILCFSAVATAQELDPALSRALARADAHTKIPVLIVMQSQGLSPARQAALRQLSRHARRAQGRADLQNLAASSQLALNHRLADLVKAGRAQEVRPLFLLNAVMAKVEAGAVSDLLSIPGVQRIRWDPPVPLDEMIDNQSGPVSAPPVALASEASPQIWWQVTRVNAPSAWMLGYKGQGVVVAIVDTGLDYTHPDLASHIYTNPGEIPNNGIDDDHNGFIDDVHGWNFVENDNDPMGDGPTDHGTSVAGIVAGDGTSGTATGVAPEAILMPVKAIGGTWGQLYEGLDYAVMMNADIIQMSASEKWWNQDGSLPDYASWRVITDNELALGIVHVNSIGNEGNNQDIEPIPLNVATPGNCPPPWLNPNQYIVGGLSSIVAVGAIAYSQNMVVDGSSRGPSAWEDFSQYFPQYPYNVPPQYQDYPYGGGQGGLIKPDLVAPGYYVQGYQYNTRSTQEGGGYVDFGGTSAATPHVAGAMAILLSADSTLTPDKLDMLLETTATDLGAPGKDPCYGAGLVNVFAALIKTLNQKQYGSLSGTVRDAVTDSVLCGAKVNVVGPVPGIVSNSVGGYWFSLYAGSYTIGTNAFGYQPDSTVTSIVGGTATYNDLLLTPIPRSMIVGTVKGVTGTPLVGARITVQGTPLPTVLSDSSGSFLMSRIPVGIRYNLQVAKFNYHTTLVPFTLAQGVNDTVQVQLPQGLYDDFEADEGWTRGSNDNATLGWWERVAPVGTWWGTSPVQPDSDFSSNGTLCYITENTNPGSGPTLSEVRGGKTTLLSPIFDGTLYRAPVLSYRRWYHNDQAGGQQDEFLADVSSDGGNTWVNLETVTASNAAWTLKNFTLTNSVPLTSTMQIRFTAQDSKRVPTTVECGIDEVKITDATSGVQAGGAGGSGWPFRLYGNSPNPFLDATVIRFDLPQPASARLAIYDANGRWKRDLAHGMLDAGPHVVSWNGRDASGRPCASGIYFYKLDQGTNHAQGRLVLLR